MMITDKQKWFINKLLKEIEAYGDNVQHQTNFYGVYQGDSYRCSSKEASEDIQILLEIKKELETSGAKAVVKVESEEVKFFNANNKKLALWLKKNYDVLKEINNLDKPIYVSNSQIRNASEEQIKYLVRKYEEERK